MKQIGTPTLEVPKEPAVRRAWIVYQLRLRGESLASVGRQIGVSQQAVQNALLLPSSYCEKALAKTLGLTVQQLFPERFDEHGHRLFKTREQQRNTARSRRNVKDGEAA